jgi:hypothetical protein
MGFFVQRFFHVCGHSPPAASRRLLAYDIPVYDIFVYSIFSPFIFLFLISAPRWWWRSGILSHLRFFYSLALLAHFQYDVLYKF